MTLEIEPDGIALVLSAADGLEDRIERMKHDTGFVGGAIFKPVGLSGEKLAYTRWRDLRSAEAALDSGDVATLRANPVQAISVRLKASPADERGKLAIDEIGMVVLVVRMAVDPERSDALVENLRSFTDEFLPAFAPIRAVAFHRSPDRTLIIEVLNVAGALRLAMLQIRGALRRHRREVEALTRTETHDLLRLERIVQPDRIDQ